MTTNIKSKSFERENSKLPVHGWLGLGLVILAVVSGLITAAA